MNYFVLSFTKNVAFWVETLDGGSKRSHFSKYSSCFAESLSARCRRLPSPLLVVFICEEPFELRCTMPSLQTALPPELANNAIRLYRECLRRAKYIGSKQHNTQLLVGMVRQQFKKHMHETDPDKIQKLKDDAARGLINHMLHESEKMTGRKFSQGSWNRLLAKYQCRDNKDTL